MTLTKNHKIFIGVAILGVAGYMYWKAQQEKNVTCKAAETNVDGKCVAIPTCTAPKVLRADKTTCIDSPVCTSPKVLNADKNACV